MVKIKKPNSYQSDMKKLFLIAIALTLLLGIFVYKDEVLNSFSALGQKSKEKLNQTIDEEIKQPLADAVQKKIDETFDKLKESLTGEATPAQNQTPSKPLRLETPGTSSETELSKNGIFAWTNVERVRNGNLPVYFPDTKLDEIARLRLEDMFQKQYFDHVSPSSESASTEAKVVGYEFASIGENIALGNFGSDEKLVKAWMNSPGHRANILHSNFQKLGVAVREGIFEGEKTWLAVQIFAKPLSVCPLVNENLKNKIDTEKAKLSDLQIQADVLRSDIESQNPQTKEEVNAYNQKVETYNSIVAQINALLAEIKSDIETYNHQINLFNTCVAG